MESATKDANEIKSTEPKQATMMVKIAESSKPGSQVTNTSTSAVTTKTITSDDAKKMLVEQIQIPLEADDFEIAESIGEMPELSVTIELNKSLEKDLEYFSYLPVARQSDILKSLNVSKTALQGVIRKHRRESIARIDEACERLKAEQLMSKPKEKSEVLRMRYKTQIETFVNNGIKPVKIAGWLTEHDKANYPKAKQYVYSVALVKAFIDGACSVRNVKSIDS